jgi:hypothetical protein
MAQVIGDACLRSFTYHQCARLGRFVFRCQDTVDSIETLKSLDQPIELFVNDSDHSAEYEAAEYVVVESRLAPEAIVVSDNAEVTPALLDWSQRLGCRFMYWSDEPKDHWFPGGGLSVSIRLAGNGR